MLIYLIRHGETLYNREQRYIGTLDPPLSERGRAALCQASFSPEVVYVSPLRRAVESAELLFPNARLETVADLREMAFGIFEGRSSAEMAQDVAYQAWVAGNCLGRCPGGESRTEFSRRNCAAFSSLVEHALAQRAQNLVIVAHGGHRWQCWSAMPDQSGTIIVGVHQTVQAIFCRQTIGTIPTSCNW